MKQILTIDINDMSQRLLPLMSGGWMINSIWGINKVNDIINIELSKPIQL